MPVPENSDYPWPSVSLFAPTCWGVAKCTPHGPPAASNQRTRPYAGCEEEQKRASFSILSPMICQLQRARVLS
jgi:hypothetical protein